MIFHSGENTASHFRDCIRTDNTRSQGYGSLSIWIKSIQDGLHYHDRYVPGNGSCPSNWTGSAITVGGGYVWQDVYDFAATHGVIAVGGADPVSSSPRENVIRIHADE